MKPAESLIRMFFILYPVGTQFLVLSFCTWSQFVSKSQSQVYSWYNMIFFILTSIMIAKWFWVLFTDSLLQGVSRLEDITAGGDFLGLCDLKSSYKHVSNFGRLRSYDRLKLRIEGNDY
jgi:hypothetical protein